MNSELKRSLLSGFAASLLTAIATLVAGFVGLYRPLDARLVVSEGDLRRIVEVMETQMWAEAAGSGNADSRQAKEGLPYLRIRGQVLDYGAGDRYRVSAYGIPVSATYPDDRGYFSLPVPDDWAGREVTFEATRLRDRKTTTSTVLVSDDVQLTFLFADTF